MQVSDHSEPAQARNAVIETLSRPRMAPNHSVWAVHTPKRSITQTMESKDTETRAGAIWGARCCVLRFSIVYFVSFETKFLADGLQGKDPAWNAIYRLNNGAVVDI